MFEAIQNTFDLQDVDLANYSPLTLAYIGDCVYELFVLCHCEFFFFHFG